MSRLILFPVLLSPSPPSFYDIYSTQLYATLLFTPTEPFPFAFFSIKMYVNPTLDSCLQTQTKTHQLSPVLGFSLATIFYLFISTAKSKENLRFISISQFLPHQCFLLPDCQISQLPISLLAAFNPSNRPLDMASSSDSHSTICSWFYLTI